MFSCWLDQQIPWELLLSRLFHTRGLKSKQSSTIRDITYNQVELRLTPDRGVFLPSSSRDTSWWCRVIGDHICKKGKYAQCERSSSWPEKDAETETCFLHWHYLIWRQTRRRGGVNDIWGSVRPKQKQKCMGCSSFGWNISAKTHLPIQLTALLVVHHYCLMCTSRRFIH